MRFNAALVYLLTGVLAAGPMLHAQQPQTSGAPPQKLVDTPKGTLKINVLEGEGGKNTIATRTAVAPVVEVKDASDKPVAGAEVVFQLPMAGPGGSFNGWLKTQTVRSDDQGKATVAGYAPNTEAGRFNIKVTATMGSQTGTAVIGQSNVEGAATASKMPNTAWKKWVALAVGAGAIGGIAAAVHGNKTSTPAAAAVPVSISAGSVSVAIPR
ncbi:MAG: hypothetical protein U0Q16_15415 [Bryobacteraceae bacterium]